MAEHSADVIIIGAGLAGLCCALRLRDAGVACTVLEASSDVGGRVWTDKVDGYTLDRGFQVLLTSYPECKRLLDYDALRLGRFSAGAIIRRGGKWHRLFDVRRHPSEAIGALASPLLTWGDRLKLVKLWAEVTRGDADEVLRRGVERTTEAELAAIGLSDEAVAGVMRPFFAGVFLQQELTSSARLFRYLFRLFAEGHAALPADGMQAIPRQLAARLPAGTIRLHARVESIGEGAVQVNAETLHADAILIATEGPEAVRLTGDESLKPPAGHAKRTSNLYYAADEPPTSEPTLILNGEGRGDAKLNNVTVPSNVCASYAPSGKALVSVQVIDAIGVEPAKLEADVRAELRAWFGQQVNAWRHLKTFQVPYALPSNDPPTLEIPERSVRLGGRPGLYVCGDHRDQASIQGAMVSGRRAAEALLEDLRVAPRQRSESSALMR